MLPPLPELLIFLGACLALNATPGADFVYSLSSGIRGGWRAAIGASLGIGTGLVFHVLLASFGLAALIASHPQAFELMRWLGVAWLVWLGVQAFRAGPARFDGKGGAGGFQAWRQGTLVNLLNPKTIIFILAFLPQFVDPARGSGALQMLALGMIFVVTSTISCALIGGFAAGLGGVLARNPMSARAMVWFSGSIMMALAARLAFDRR
ncbi:MAG: LysE family translocator [Aestuariivirgaceae bacterium]|nr:LysE family translocator [Aestuariivirgaceae bacterium]